MSFPIEQATLLVVDDEDLNLDMLSRRLTRSGFAVRTARNGLEALASIEQQKPDLVLLDQMMPGMSGREVLAQLRSNDATRDMPVIMVTAVAESDKIAEALEAGANDYVTKPIDYQVALARLRVQLASREAHLKLQVSEERYQLAARASRDALWDWNVAAGTVYYSPRWVEMLGIDAGQAGNCPEVWLSRVFPADLPSLKDTLANCIAGKVESLVCDYRMQHADGSIRWMSSRAIPTREGSVVVRMSGSQSDVTEEKTLDTLTGLPNRLAMVSRVEHLFAQAQRRTDAVALPYALLYLDLDGFKTVNDSLGHLAGDHLLQSVAMRLREARQAMQADPATESVRIMVARMGGDEFAMLVESPEPLRDAEQLAACVQRRMLGAVKLDSRAVHCAFSIGVAVAQADHPSAEDLVCDADLAMYSAKTGGRGSIAVFDQTMRAAAIERLELENDLRTAAEAEQFSLVYQPKVRLADGAIYGVEALLRWNHPKRGTIAPSVFIPIAEKTGAILDIGLWVLKNACLQVLAWRKRYPMQQPLELSVNLSPCEFHRQDLVEQVWQVLQATGYPPETLHLEITEGVLFEDLEQARQTLLQLRKLGVMLDLDDFGSGYSSLRYLQELPFDTLKIDRHFVSKLDVQGAASSSEMIHTILAMAGTLNLQVVAEGIETFPHAQELRRLGCELGQGYYYSKPVAVAEMETLLAQTSDSERHTTALTSPTLTDPTLTDPTLTDPTLLQCTMLQSAAEAA